MRPRRSTTWRPGSPPPRSTGSWCPAPTAQTTRRGSIAHLCAPPPCTAASTRRTLSGNPCIWYETFALCCAPHSELHSEVHLRQGKECVGCWERNILLGCLFAVAAAGGAAAHAQGARQRPEPEGLRAHAQLHTVRHRAHALLRARELPDPRRRAVRTPPDLDGTFMITCLFQHHQEVLDKR